MSIYDKLTNSVSKTTVRRQWIFFNNNFIKLLMIEGLTIPRKY